MTRTTRTGMAFFPIVSVYILFAAGCNVGPVASDHAPDATARAAVSVKGDPADKPLVNDGSWQASASSVEEGFAPEMAVDDQTSTRWSSLFEDHQWWQVDFGQPHQLHNIVIHWEDAFAASYRVKVSDDGQTWDPVLHERTGAPGVHRISFDSRPARFVRIECERRGTEWGFSIYDVQFNVPDEPRMIATASSGAGDYAPHFAIDGNFSTRWSSEFRDDEWWQVEFEEPRTLTGMNIHWETAFAEKYEVAVSSDGREWRTIYDVTEGDGQLDMLVFEPVETKFLRIVCRQRGTGWGNSIYNIEFLDEADQVQARASSQIDGHGPERAVDGRPHTFWKSADDGEQYVELEFPRARGLGGVVLHWGEHHAVAYHIEGSVDGEEWTTLYREGHSGGERDYVFFPALDALRLRVVGTTSRAGEGYELAHIELKGRDAQATPLREYQARARNAKRGRYPMWLTREQEFWTVTGLPDDDQESLIGETGTFEPYKGAFSVQPFVLVNDELYSWADVTLEQELEADYLPMPTVDWSAAGWNLQVAALTFGEPGAAFTAVRYRLHNAGDQPLTAALVLAVRPIQLNPGWQHGGMSHIGTAECVTHSASATVRINEKPAILFPSLPEQMGAASLSDGDVNDYLNRGLFPDQVRAADEEGKVGVGIRYVADLPAHGHYDVVVLYPLHDETLPSGNWEDDPSGAFERIWADGREAWSALLDAVIIDIPESRLIETMKSNLGYVLINYDPPWFKPGTRNYNHSWIRDGALTGVATLRMGLTEQVRAFIEKFTDFINEDGWVPYIITEDGQPIGYNPNMEGGEGHEFDSQGQYVHIVRQYYDFTGDRELLRTVYPEVLRALEYGREIRKRRLTDEYKDTVYWGILPHSNSHEGYFPAKHSYWDNFFMLLGLKDGAYLAEEMNDPESAAWMRAEEAELRRHMNESIRRVIERDNIPYIPGCAELGDEDPTSTSVAVITCDEASHLPQDILHNTFERYWERVSRRHAGTPDTFTPYEVRNAEVFIRFGQRDRALAMFRHFMEDSMRPRAWNHMAEVVHERPRAPSYIGDMPHTWVGSDYINAVRSMFSYVENDTLVLAAGVDPAWLTTGVRVEHLPTQYGRIHYRMKKVNGTVVFEARGEPAPPNGFALQLPSSLWEQRAMVNDQPADIMNGVVHFEHLPVIIQITP